MSVSSPGSLSRWCVEPEDSLPPSMSNMKEQYGRLQSARKIPAQTGLRSDIRIGQILLLEDGMRISNRFSDWMDRYWTVLVIIFGIAFTLFLALFKPHTDWANY
jgi:hypothetical protein